MGPFESQVEVEYSVPWGGLTERVVAVPDDDEFAALDQLPKVQKMLYKHRKSAYGSVRGVRLDIPSVKRGIPVVSIHEKPRGGTIIGYDHSATIQNATFIVQASGVKSVGAKGGNKFPFAYIGGKLSGEKAQTQGTKITFDPRKVHLFVDASNMRPVRGAQKVYMIGSQVYASGVDYFGSGEAPEAPAGMNSKVKMP